MRRAILALAASILLAGCLADNRIALASRFGNLFGLAQQSRQSGDFSQALSLFAAARDAAATPQQRYLASLGQFDLAVQTKNPALAAEAANAVLASGATVDPVLQASLQGWTNAGAVIEAPPTIGGDPGPAPDPAPTPAVPGGGSAPAAEDPADESIQPNADGSVPLRALERQRRNLAPGVAEFHVPPDMVEKDEAEVWYKVQASQVGTFRIVPGPGAATSGAASRVYHVKVGRCMSAELSGAGFAIRPAQDAIQNTGADRSAEWRWLVTPNRAGPRKLTLTSRVLAYVAGRCAEQLELLPRQERSVEVKVAPPGPAPAPDRPKPDPAPEPKPGGIIGWLGLIGIFVTALAALLAKVNGLFDEFGKFRDRLATLLGRNPKQAAAPPDPA